MNYFTIPAVKTKNIGLENIICEAFDVRLDLLQSRTRLRQVIDAKKAMRHYKRKALNMTFVSIAMSEDIDHSTVIYSVNKTDDLLEHDKEFKAKYDKFLKLIKL